MLRVVFLAILVCSPRLCWRGAATQEDSTALLSDIRSRYVADTIAAIRRFFQGLQDLGYVHGQNINISYLSADNNGDRFPTLIDECLSSSRTSSL